jgi:hypothetical protein
MSWASFWADMQDVRDLIGTGKTLAKALEECGHSRSQAVFVCVVCGTKGGIAVKHLLDRHFNTGSRALPSECGSDRCNGQAFYSGVE